MAVAHAQELPARFTVTGVAADDVLNVRAGPSARNEILARLAPGQRGVEVVRLSDDGKWGMVAVPESNGWVSMRYLAAEPMPADALPRPVHCYGTEPFWSITFNEDGIVYRSPDDELPLSLRTESALTDGWQALLYAGVRGDWAVDIRRGECSDGMSDRLFGLSIKLQQSGVGATGALAGCCTLDAR